MFLFKYCSECMAGPFISRAEKHLHKAQHRADKDPLYRLVCESADLQERVTALECVKPKEPR